ncbi:MAG: hypothetical protein DMF57_15165, partial [Acidobacteria bacterium]
WHGLTLIAQGTKQLVAGLHRQGEEVESGYAIPFAHGILQSIQPAVRVSALQNRFRGPPQFVAPSVWWNWVKIDYGVRIGFARNLDVTIEETRHNIVAPRRLKLPETLVTLRVRYGA